jgi:hypothetical protein
MNIQRISLLMLIALWVVANVGFAGADEELWRIHINIPQCRLYLYRERELYQTYKIAVGKRETPSPVGEFRIVNKVFNPTWYPGGGRKPIGAKPSNPLGKYWLGLNLKGYGIHGNNSAQSIGKPVSGGCFRMDNVEISELFRLVPVETPVNVTYTTMAGWEGPDREVYLEIFPDIYQRTNPYETALSIIYQLAPDRQPHLFALTKLLNQSPEGIFPVPYPVKVRADEWIWDAFRWNHEVYIARVDTEYQPENGIFSGYHSLSDSGELGEKYRFDWEPDTQSLRIRHKTETDGVIEKSFEDNL